MTIGIYSASDTGHRREYTDFVKEIFDCEEISSESLISYQGTVFFLMIEDSFSQYLRVSLMRSILGKNTAGLLFRPSPAAAAETWKLKIKHAALAFLKRIPTVKTLSIIPEFLDPKIGALIDGWIYDFQLWDMDADTVQMVKARKVVVPDLQEDLRDIQAEKPILVALGSQDPSKGTRILSDAMAGGLLDRWQVVTMGRFSAEVADCAKVIAEAGGTCISRFINKDELLAGYAMADAVWCHYDESYDQASGILGRAIQFGVPAVVRPGSVSDRLSQHFNFPTLTLETMRELAQSREAGLGQERYKNRDVAAEARVYSLRVLEAALGCKAKVS